MSNFISNKTKLNKIEITFNTSNILLKHYIDDIDNARLVRCTNIEVYPIKMHYIIFTMQNKLKQT